MRQTKVHSNEVESEKQAGKKLRTYSKPKLVVVGAAADLLQSTFKGGNADKRKRQKLFSEE